MSSDGSEQMMGLLKELSVYKAMDEDYTAGPKGRVETAAHDERERRRREIQVEMHALAAQNKINPT